MVGGDRERRVNGGSSAVLPLLSFFHPSLSFSRQVLFFGGRRRRVNECPTRTTLKTARSGVVLVSEVQTTPRSRLPKEKKKKTKQPNHQIKWKISINKYENTGQKVIDVAVAPL